MLHKLIELCELIKNICSKYPNIKVVEGFKLVPCMEKYFKDKLHSNALGAEMYGKILVDEIQKIEF